MTFPGILVLLFAATSLFYVGYKAAQIKEKAEAPQECGCGGGCPCKSGKN